jgi:hypothetical protein
MSIKEDPVTAEELKEEYGFSLEEFKEIERLRISSDRYFQGDNNADATGKFYTILCKIVRVDENINSREQPVTIVVESKSNTAYKYYVLLLGSGEISPLNLSREQKNNIDEISIVPNLQTYGLKDIVELEEM